MSHRFYEGEIFHKRFHPQVHHFTYDYFFIDINIDEIGTLNNSLFKTDSLGVMSFYPQDHFGKHQDFAQSVRENIASLGWQEPSSIRFLTLPRIFHFVFNPISMVLLLDSNSEPTHAIAEVHNYNGGRVLYPMTLQKINPLQTQGSAQKSMYVSPFMGYEGTYTFTIDYTPEHFGLRIELSEENRQMLVAHFSGSSIAYSTSSIRRLLCNHTFLSLFVVTRTLWQSLRLKLKALPWYSPRPQDQIKQESL